MDGSQDPRQELALRLRALREERWPRTRVTQPQLARALGSNKPLSVPLISSWESATNPKIPPIPRLEAYATFFATRRSIEGNAPRLLDIAELTIAERDSREDLRRELLRLRGHAMRGSGVPTDDVIESLNAGYWRFEDGRPVTIVCAQMPPDMTKRIPYSDPADPHYVALSGYADLDALFELHGHVRAANPASEVTYRNAQLLESDDYTTHLISLGGVDWNLATRSVLNRLELPVRQVADWNDPDGPYFEVEQAGRAVRYRPRLDRSGERERLLEDVALFARAVNPFNRKRTVSICNGMYAAGTFGAVRALTDTWFRDRNTEYARANFGASSAFCILVKVTVENGVPVTPDWTLPENRLFEWASESR